MKIRIKVSDNPKQIGSKARQRFALYDSGMTVETYVAACKNKTTSGKYALNDITWDLEHGFIELGMK